MGRCQNCYTVECRCGSGTSPEDWQAVGIFDDADEAQRYAAGRPGSRVVEDDCANMPSCRRSASPGGAERYRRTAGGVIRYARDGSAFYSTGCDVVVRHFAAYVRRADAYRVDQWVRDRWTAISHGLTLEQALAPLGGQKWFVRAPTDRYRTRLRCSAVLSTVLRTGKRSRVEVP